MKALGALTVAAALLGGCGGELTEIFACYSFDPAYDGTTGTATLVADTLEGRPLWDSDLAPPWGPVIQQGFVRRSAEGVRLALRLVLENQPDPMGGAEPVTVVLEQVASVRFQPGRVVDVTLWIEAACVGVVCGADLTCVGGGCLPEEVPPECLADRGEAALSECGDGRVRRACRAADGSL